MSDAPATSPEFPPLGCSAIVYRALLRSSLIDKTTGRISAGAFMRRAKDVDGLSVYVSANYSKRQIVLDFDPCHGIVSLHVGRIRDIGLDVQCPPSTSPAPCCARTLPTLRRSRPRAGTKRFRIVSKPFVAAASIASGTDGGEAPDYELVRACSVIATGGPR